VVEQVGLVVERAESEAEDCVVAIMVQAHIDGPPTVQLASHCAMSLFLAHTGPEEGDAAHLSVVAATKLAMRPGPTEFRPFDGLWCTGSPTVESLA
jgi:phytoene dehydrogenase-like protein